MKSPRAIPGFWTPVITAGATSTTNANIANQKQKNFTVRNFVSILDAPLSREFTLNADRRRCTRFNPNGLSAHLIIDPTHTHDNIVVEGSVLDISYSGIKLKLHQRLQATFEEAHIQIVIRLPESGVPMTIHGMIRHIHEADSSHCGLQYADHHQESELDELMFECIKLAPNRLDETTLSMH